MKKITEIVSAPGRIVLGETPEGFDALVLADLARNGRANGEMVMHIARDDARMIELAEGLTFFAPDVAVELFPAWDCLPYDRVSPQGDISARRMATLSRLAARKEADEEQPFI
ncbi:MAG: hypothetical protein K9G30_00275, partial [Parvibaculum sp.]|nr:hypothetical protein [Parvibaculum sp.]